MKRVDENICNIKVFLRCVDDTTPPNPDGSGLNMYVIAAPG